MAEKKFEEVTPPPMWKPEKEGDEIEGEIVEFKKGKFSDRQAVLKAPSEELFSIPSFTVLENKMSGINERDYIKITYLGEKKGKGDTYKDFKLEKAV